MDELTRKHEILKEVPCDHCGHRYDVHFYRPDTKHAGCNECVGEGLICPGFHAGTVNVDLSPICANCNHTEGAHVSDYKGNREDWCNVLECLCRKFKPVDESSQTTYQMDNPINYPNEPCDDGTCGHLGRNHAALLKESFGKELDRTPCLITGCDCERYWAPEGDEEIREEVVEETIIETTITRTTTITVDLPIGVQELIDELNRIATAHGPGAEIRQARDQGGLGLGVSRVELTIE